MGDDEADASPAIVGQNELDGRRTKHALAVEDEDRLVVDELVLVDPDLDRLDVVGGMASRMLRRRGWAGDLVTTDDRRRGIDGADFVIIQLRVISA